MRLAITSMTAKTETDKRYAVVVPYRLAHPEDAIPPGDDPRDGGRARMTHEAVVGVAEAIDMSERDALDRLDLVEPSIVGLIPFALVGEDADVSLVNSLTSVVLVHLEAGKTKRPVDLVLGSRQPRESDRIFEDGAREDLRAGSGPHGWEPEDRLQDHSRGRDETRPNYVPIVELAGGLHVMG